MNKHKVQEVRADIEQVLQLVAEKHGLSLDMKGGRYNAHEYMPKVRFVQISDTNADSAAQYDWDKYCSRFGYTSGDFGRDVIFGDGRSGTITGIKPRATRYPILVRRSDGSMRKCSPSSIQLL